jgi:glutamate racemase
MIGVFDSGLGGMQTLLYLRAFLPTYTYFYLWDTHYLPYGEKSGEWIRTRTFQCLDRLFAKGCTLVIMACNTASAFALREWQETYPDRKVLSVTVPGVEAIVAGNFHAPLLLATKLTIETHIYELVRHRAFPDYVIAWHVQIGTGRVDALESWLSSQEVRQIVSLSNLSRFKKQVDCVVLWCTHYPLIKKYIAEDLPDVPLIDPAYEAATKLRAYLQHHPEIVKKLTESEMIHLFVTWSPQVFNDKIRALWWIDQQAEQAVIE